MAVGRAQAELEHGLEAPAEVLVEEAVDDGVDAAVEEGQPVGEGVDVDVDDAVLLHREPGVVAQHHQRPQGQPGQDEEQGHDQQHLDHPLLLLGHRVPVVVTWFAARRHGRLEECDADAAVHDDDEGQRGEVDVGEQDRGVDLAHALVGPVFSAPIKGSRFVVVS